MSGRIIWGCTNIDEFNDHCNRPIRLYQGIQRDGYKLQSELINSQRSSRFDIEEEIGVCISRDGKMLFSDGAHRLAIAKLLNLSQLPVKVSVRHPQLIKIKNELISKVVTRTDPSNPPNLYTDLYEKSPAIRATNQETITNK
jgi:hypothetical protein